MYPKLLFFPDNTYVTVPFDVIDSNYTRLTNDSTDCSYFVVNNTGGGIASGDLIYNDTFNYWNFQLTETQTELIGDYNIYVHCNSSNLENGFVSLSYEITSNGRETKNDVTAGLSITFFLLLVNTLLFALPFWIRIKRSKAADFMIKRMLWLASLLLLWFNTTIFRTIAIDYNLGIDEFLLVYWWMFTLGTFMVIFLMVYFMVVGLIKIMKEVKFKKRMGGEDERETSKNL